MVAASFIHTTCTAVLCILFYISGKVSSLSVSPTLNTMPPFALNAKMSIRPEKREAWLEQIKDDQLCTRRDEQGNLQFVITEDETTPNTFYLHEQFIDESAFEEHTKTPHFARYDDFCKAENPFAPDGDMELLLFSPLGEGSDWSKSKRDIPKTAFCVTVNLYPKIELREAFLKVIQNNKEGTEGTEPLALQYTYGESTTVANVFHFHEQYTGAEDGKEGFNAHAAAPHFIEWEAFAGTDPFAKPPEVYFSKVIE
jgi:quinol monooxygenase YgiN